MSGFDERPSALLATALVRARTCELLALAAGEPRPGSYFPVGLLSVLDARMPMAMAAALVWSLEAMRGLGVGEDPGRGQPGRLRRA